MLIFSCGSNDNRRKPVLACLRLGNQSGKGGTMLGESEIGKRVAALLGLALCVLVYRGALSADEPWADDPAVQEVLELRRKSIAAMTSGGPTPESERYSSTFVANTPAGGVVSGEQMRAAFARGSVSYAEVEQKIEYAGSHGPDLVVLMGEEVVVPRAGAPNAGKRIHRRFTDIFRRENGEWRHDVRHANVVSIED
jgi:hypothetical protein